MASHWVGLTLPGMIEEPGSFSGKRSSPNPERGPEPNQRISLAIFINEAAKVFNTPLKFTMVSWQPKASNLLRAVLKGFPVIWAIFSADLTGNCGCVLSPVPTAVPPNANS